MTKRSWQILSILAILGLGLGGSLRAQNIYGDEHLVLEKGAMREVKGGKSSLLEKELKLPNGVVVKTNGVLVLPGNEEKKLAEGQKLSPDGFYMAGDGRFLEIRDHVMLQNGKLTVVKDGAVTPATGATTLKDGTVVQADGVFTRRDARRGRLLDGQMLSLGGEAIPSVDHVMMRSSGVVLQKDGSLMNLGQNRVMAMADGTKVRGTGEVTYTDGKTVTLKPGQRLVLSGATRRQAQ